MSPTHSARLRAMTYEQLCPRCGRSSVGEDADGVADEVVEHARVEHRHALDRNVVLAHLEGVRPDERES